MNNLVKEVIANVAGYGVEVVVCNIVNHTFPRNAGPFTKGLTFVGGVTIAVGSYLGTRDAVRAYLDKTFPDKEKKA